MSGANYGLLLTLCDDDNLFQIIFILSALIKIEPVLDSYERRLLTVYIKDLLSSEDKEDLTKDEIIYDLNFDWGA